MANQRGRPPTHAQPPPRMRLREIKETIEKSGYPFEIAIGHRFETAGAHVTYGFPFQVSAEESIEVDIIARVGERRAVGDVFIDVLVIPLVEAKVFHSPNEFIGFQTAAVDELTRRTSRMALSGTPTYNVLTNGMVTPPWMTNVVLACTDPLNGGDWCGRWGVLRQQKTGNSLQVAGGGDEWDAIKKLLRAHRAAVVENARFAQALSDSMVPPASLEISFPVLAIDVPHLHVYDARTKRLRRSKWVVLNQMLVLDGEARMRILDVVCKSALPGFISACQETARRLADCATTDGEAIVVDARMQRAEVREERLKRTARFVGQTIQRR